MALSRLEQHTGTTLCRRGPGGFELTADGAPLVEICEGMFSAACDIPGVLENAAKEVRGRVRIQMITNFVDAGIDDAIRAFHRDRTNVEVFVSVSTWDVIQRGVMKNEVEIGMAPVTLRTSGPVYEPLFPERHSLFLGKCHPLFGTTFDRPRDLADHGFILTGADEPASQVRYRQRHGLGKRVAGLSEHLEEARRLTLAGVGLCSLSEAFVARDVADGTLHEVLADDDAPKSTIFVISNPKAPNHRARTLMPEYLRISSRAANRG